MKGRIERALLIANLHKKETPELIREIRDELEAGGALVETCAFEGVPVAPPSGPFDIAFSLGGDGTVLFAARCLFERDIPIFPINLGTLGFIASIQKDEWRSILSRYVQGEVPTSPRLMLETIVERDGKVIGKQFCLNDAVVAGAGISKIIRLTVVTETLKLGAYRADGFIIATPTGSTAYSVAAGGPILDPEMEAMILNPVCPFTLANRAIVVPALETITICIEKEQRSDVMLTVDGQIVVSLLPGDTVKVRRADRKVHIIASDRAQFFNVLRSKLNWSGGPDA
jgi:NAD+ kinase